MSKEKIYFRKMKYLVPLPLLLSLLFTCLTFGRVHRQPSTPVNSAIPSLSRAQQTPPSDNSQIILNVTVTNSKGNYLWAIDKSRFAVNDGKDLKEITSFRYEDTPASVGVILDTSASMGSVLTKVKGAMAHFIELSNRSNEYFVISFSDHPQLQADWTHDPNEAISKIGSIRPTGQTSLYDACIVGLEKLSTATCQKHVLLLITDGLDNRSRHNFKELRRLLEEKTDILLYAVGVGIHEEYEIAGEQVLFELARISGGRAVSPRNITDFNAAFERIAVELRHQYMIGFKPANDGKWHGIKIKLVAPGSAPEVFHDAALRSRKGYWASTK